VLTTNVLVDAIILHSVLPICLTNCPLLINFSVHLLPLDSASICFVFTVSFCTDFVLSPYCTLCCQTNLIWYEDVMWQTHVTHTHTCWYLAYIPADESKGLSCRCRMLFVAVAVDVGNATSRLSRCRRLSLSPCASLSMVGISREAGLLASRDDQSASRRPAVGMSRGWCGEWARWWLSEVTPRLTSLLRFTSREYSTTAHNSPLHSQLTVTVICGPPENRRRPQETASDHRRLQKKPHGNFKFTENYALKFKC